MKKRSKKLAVARVVGEHDTKLWRVVHHSVDDAQTRKTDTSFSAMIYLSAAIINSR